MRINRLIVLLALTAAAAGCGQKGPLVLPDAQHPPHKKVKFPGAPKQPAAPSATPGASAPTAPASGPAPTEPVPAPDPMAPEPDPAPQG